MLDGGKTSSKLEFLKKRKNVINIVTQKQYYEYNKKPGFMARFIK
jgi:hypothetical protein